MSASGLAAALAGHKSAAAEFGEQMRRVPTEHWHASPGDGKWSPAEEALHVALSYEVGLAALTTGSAMHLRHSGARARLLRWFVLPVMLRTGWFPRAAAPREVRPPRAEAVTLDVDAMHARMQQAVAAVTKAAEVADPRTRVVHAYFGPLRPLTAVQLLAAHTRHHARRLSHLAHL